VKGKIDTEEIMAKEGGEYQSAELLITRHKQNTPLSCSLIGVSKCEARLSFFDIPGINVHKKCFSEHNTRSIVSNLLV
jgi:hypothetical protein